jgi:hypothetical protein
MRLGAGAGEKAILQKSSKDIQKRGMTWRRYSPYSTEPQSPKGQSTVPLDPIEANRKNGKGRSKSNALMRTLRHQNKPESEVRAGRPNCPCAKNEDLMPLQEDGVLASE